MRNKSSVAAFAVAVLAVAACAACQSARNEGAPDAARNTAAPNSGTTTATNEAERQNAERADADLAARFKALAARAGGSVGVALIHVETGRTVSVGGDKPLPLYSVFKLPLAVAVLKDAEENKLRVDDQVRVEPDETAPGTRANTDLWREPVELTVAELIELSIVRSDNTSSDKLLELVGGPAVVTRRMRALGLQNIDVHYSVREFLKHRDKPNTGTADDLARLLARLRKGEVLREPQLSLLLGSMGRAVTGLKRLRGDLPEGTPVADKTGTGEATTNDVGIITLPEGKGHLAMAVFVDRSKLSSGAQEKLIAELARAAYDAHVRPNAYASR